MRKTIVAVAVAVSLPLFAAAPRGVVALGVGASSPSDIVVKIDGKNTHVKLAGVTGGNPKTQTFLDCLVARRVLRVDRAAGRATLLDGTSLADHVAEFEQSRTSADPCTLGRSAYVQETPHVSAAAAAAPAKSTTKTAPSRGHVSFGSTATPATAQGKLLGVTGYGEKPKAAAPTALPAKPGFTDLQTTPSIYQPPVTQGQPMMVPGTIYTPPAAATTTVGAAQTYTIPPGQTTTIPTATTTTIPTTTTSPP